MTNLTSEKTSTTTADAAQQLLWSKTQIFRETIVAKLREAHRPDLARPIDLCGTEETILTCTECGHWKSVWNRCDNRWCPSCGPLRTRKRAEELSAWTKTLQQPKHLTLTNRNSGVLTGFAVAIQLKGLAAIRRRKFARNWKSGSWTIEVTNEGRGWHLHEHLLIESRWIDMPAVAKAWARYTGQDDNAIVSVKDARSSDYLSEVAKYVCKPAQLAAWSPVDIVQVMDAFRGRRAFGVFGDAVGQRAEWKKAVAQLRHKRSQCDCGACDWIVEPAYAMETGRRFVKR